MPEHDEDDAPTGDNPCLTDEQIVELHEQQKRKRKAERWGVEDKVVDGESK